jgi:hypothetical protein
MFSQTAHLAQSLPRLFINTINPKGAIPMSRNQRKVIRTTLGDLIAAVTDEVKPFARNRSGLYMTVSRILSDLLTRDRRRVGRRSLRKYRRNFAQEIV